MTSALEQAFERVAAFACGAAHGGETLVAAVCGESSSFVRFNHGRIRQAGDVERIVVRLRLARAPRAAIAEATLPGEPDADARALAAALDRAREALDDAHDDPHDPPPSAATQSRRVIAASPRPGEQALAELVGRAACEIDLVGFLACGEQMRGVASSLGHRHYHEAGSWSFEFTAHGRDAALRDKAVKSLVAGRDWDADRVRDAIAAAAARLPLLARPSVAVPRGEHRVLLAPAALGELLSMLGWGGFSARALATGQSPLTALARGEAAFDPRIALADDLVAGDVPLFQEDGVVRPPRIELLRAGRLAERLVSPRTAREFGLADNGAPEDERPVAWSLAPGELAESSALAALGTGLAVSDLWYLNYSDRRSCRVTGMTRFATLWVEDGEPVGPVDPLRFDDSLYRLLGDALVALTDRAHWLPDTSTYDARAFGGTRVPGALVERMAFTL